MGFLKNFIYKTSYDIALKQYNKNLYTRSNFPLSTQKDASSGGGASAVIVGLAKRLGLRFGDLASTDFEDPEYDFDDIDSAYDTDSYVRQGIDKYIEQIFKEGWKFYGKNENAVEYINTRFRFMSEATGVPTEQFLVEVAECIVKYNNAVLAKSRMNDPSQLPQGESVAGIDGKEPIVGYFPLHPGTLKQKRDKNGLVKGWQQQSADGSQTVKFKPEDIVHIYYKRRIGYAFGTPFLVTVLDDIRVLRFLEENTVNMLYKHINPFFHIAVGDKDSPGSEPEISDVKTKLDSMDVDAGFVTSNRVVISAVESNKTISAEPYLQYFENRVFSGLGIPSVKFGRGGTANRNTADSMTDEMSDRIKAFQLCIEKGITFHIVKELLIEGGFDPLNNPDDMVVFEFLENDMDRKIKAEVHALYKYEHNGITEDEMRDEIGKDPITDRALMYQTLITQANTLFEAQTTAQFSPTPTTSSSSSSSTKGTKSTNNKNTPTNQHGTKTSSKKTTNSLVKAVIENDIDFLKSELNINDIGAKAICKVLKNRINVTNLNNNIYVETLEDRIKNMSKVFANKIQEENNAN